MLALRLVKVGKKKDKVFRVVAVDSKRSVVTGKFTEILGWWNPHNDKFELKEERIKYWLSKGAQPSDSCFNLLVTANILPGPKRKIKIKSKKKEQEEVKTEEKKAEEKTESVEKTETTETEEKQTEAKEGKKEETKTEQKPEEQNLEETTDKIKEDNKEESKESEKEENTPDTPS